jgi:hypothetical protein
MEVPQMMPQDFPSSGFEQVAGLGAIQAYDARTARALDGVERELRELRRLWAHTEAGRRDLGCEVVPELVALSDRVEALTDELHARAHHDVRPLLASERHHRRQRH